MRIMLLAPGNSIHSQRFLQWLQAAENEILFVDTYRPPNLNPTLAKFIPYPSLKNFARGLSRNPNSLEAHLSTPQPSQSDPFSQENKRLNYDSLLLKLGDLYRRTILSYHRKYFKPEVIHLHFVDGRAYDCYLARLRPLVITCWGSDINQHFRETPHPATTRKLGQALAWANHIFADSQELLDRCSQLAGTNINSSLLYFGINTDQFRPGYKDEAQSLREILNIPSSARILLSLRAWKPIYRHDLILKAFALAKPSIPFPVVLLFKIYLAGDQVYKHNILTLAKDLNVSEDIRWISDIPNEKMPEIYALADAVINFPSADGFPVSFIEAAACKKPIISNCLPPYQGTIFEEIARMSSKDSVDELAQSIINTFLEPVDIHSQKMERGRNWAVEYGDEKSSLKEVTQIYQRVIQPFH